MVDRDLAPHDEFVDRFKLAVDCHLLDARPHDLSKVVANFHRAIVSPSSLSDMVGTMVQLRPASTQPGKGRGSNGHRLQTLATD
jgi:hypothetical protein